jgi:hypothetical protein
MSFYGTLEESIFGPFWQLEDRQSAYMAGLRL